MTPFVLDHLEKVVRDYLDRDDLADGVSLVHQRSKGRGGILRLSIGEDRTVIIKTWRLNSDRDRLKRLAWMSNTRREWRIHRYLHDSGVRVPEAFAYRAGQGERGPFELIVVEDLGPLTDALSYLKSCLGAGDERGAGRLEDEVIENTARMVRHRTLDIDNKLNNFGITASGELYRLDLECARRWRFRPLPTST
ncbi:MAG: lipopolysaccharide kinase InaA family protein, partial [Wenzhouxiangella sp.]